MLPKVTIKIDGRRWQQVKSLAKSGPSDREYVAQTMHGKTTIIFGDGVRGARLPTGSNVEATYRMGSGKASEVTVSYRTPSDSTLDQALWIAIRNRTHAIGFGRYQDFMN
jgi:hypothetical protein